MPGTEHKAYGAKLAVGAADAEPKPSTTGLSATRTTMLVDEGKLRRVAPPSGDATSCTLGLAGIQCSAVQFCKAACSEYKTPNVPTSGCKALTAQAKLVRAS